MPLSTGSAMLAHWMISMALRSIFRGCDPATLRSHHGVGLQGLPLASGQITLKLVQRFVLEAFTSQVRAAASWQRFAEVRRSQKSYQYINTSGRGTVRRNDATKHTGISPAQNVGHPRVMAIRIDFVATRIDSNVSTSIGTQSSAAASCLDCSCLHQCLSGHDLNPLSVQRRKPVTKPMALQRTS